MALAIVDTGEAHSVSNVSSVTRSTTLTAGVNLLIAFAHNDGTGTCTGMTYNGSAMTSLGSATHLWFSVTDRVEAFYLANPSAGSAYDLVATWSVSRNDYGFTFASLSDYGSIGTFYSNSPATNSTGANGSVTVSDWATGDIAVASILVNATTVSNDDTLISSYISTGNNDNYVNSESTTADGNLSWTHTARPWVACGFAIKPASGGPTGSPYYAYAQQ